MKQLNTTLLFAFSLSVLFANDSFSQSLLAFKTKPLEASPIKIEAKREEKTPVSLHANIKPQDLHVPKVVEVPKPEIKPIVALAPVILPQKKAEIAPIVMAIKQAPIKETLKPAQKKSGPLRDKYTPEKYFNPDGTVKPRGPIKAIYQDTKTAILKDAPIALADALPWVDKDKKNKNYEIVLKEVADSLNRAQKSDPEWILPAKDELFELHRKLNDMPAAPQLKEEYQIASNAVDVMSEDRPFKKRPVWPGAKSNTEVSVRPVTITNEGLDGQYNHYTNDLDSDLESESHSAPHKEEVKTKAAVKSKTKTTNKHEKKAHSSGH